jgi:hypothetical protein
MFKIYKIFYNLCKENIMTLPRFLLLLSVIASLFGRIPISEAKIDPYLERII